MSLLKLKRTEEWAAQLQRPRRASQKSQKHLAKIPINSQTQIQTTQKVNPVGLLTFQALSAAVLFAEAGFCAMSLLMGSSVVLRLLIASEEAMPTLLTAGDSQLPEQLASALVSKSLIMGLVLGLLAFLIAAGIQVSAYLSYSNPSRSIGPSAVCGAGLLSPAARAGPAAEEYRVGVCAEADAGRDQPRSVLGQGDRSLGCA